MEAVLLAVNNHLSTSTILWGKTVWKKSLFLVWAVRIFAKLQECKQWLSSQTKCNTVKAVLTFMRVKAWYRLLEDTNAGRANSQNEKITQERKTQEMNFLWVWTMEARCQSIIKLLEECLSQAKCRSNSMLKNWMSIWKIQDTGGWANAAEEATLMTQLRGIHSKGKWRKMINRPVSQEPQKTSSCNSCKHYWSKSVHHTQKLPIK